MSYVETLGGLKNQSNGPDIAFQFQDNGQPWPSIVAAHAGTPEAYRAIGKIRIVNDGTGIKEYWYKDGVELPNLVRRYENLETPEIFLDQLNAIKAQTEALRDATEDFKDIALSEYEFKGDWRADTNSPHLTADATIGQTNPDKPQRYVVVVGGPLPFAIKGLVEGSVIGKGYLTQHPTGQWFFDAAPDSLTYLNEELGFDVAVDITGITFEKGRFANGNGFNSESVDWCIRSANYFAAVAGSYFLRVRDGFHVSIVESTTGNIFVGADGSLTNNTYVGSRSITITKPFIRLQIVKWNPVSNSVDSTFVFNLGSKEYLKFVQVLRTEDKLSALDRTLGQESAARSGADATLQQNIDAVSSSLTAVKTVDNVVPASSIVSYFFASQNANNNNQKAISALTTGGKYNIFVKTAAALGQSNVKIILYWAGNTQSQQILNTNANDLSKGLNIPFTANGPIDYVNIQLFTIPADKVGVNVDVAISSEAQSDLKTFKNRRSYPFANITADQYNTSVRALIREIKLVGSGWNSNDYWCIRLYRKNTSSNFLLGLYKSFGNDTIIDDGSNVSVAFGDINPNQVTGIQKVTKTIDGTRSIYLELDMAVYATLSVFQLDLNYNQTGIAKEAYVPTLIPYFAQNPVTDKPIITLIDDDGNLSFMNWLKTSLDTYGYKAGIGVVTDWVGTAGFMTTANLQAMKTAGHEIMSHSKTHAQSVWYPSSWATGYDQDAIESECKASRKWFIDNGFGLIDTLVYPNGGYDGISNKAYRVLTIETVQKYYQNALSTVVGVNSQKILDPYMLNRVAVNMAANNLAYYQGKIDDCKANCGWLILFTHSNTASEVNQSFFEAILSYIQSSGVSVMKFSDAWAVKKNIASIGVFERENSLYIGRDGSLQ